MSGKARKEFWVKLFSVLSSERKNIRLLLIIFHSSYFLGMCNLHYNHVLLNDKDTFWERHPVVSSLCEHYRVLTQTYMVLLLHTYMVLILWDFHHTWGPSSTKMLLGSTWLNFRRDGGMNGMDSGGASLWTHGIRIHWQFQQ